MVEETHMVFRAQLNDSYRDRVTGFVGLATARCTYLHGPTMVQLENDQTHRWIEENRLEEVN